MSEVVAVVNCVLTFKMPFEWLCMFESSSFSLLTQRPTSLHLYPSNCRHGTTTLWLFHASNIIFDSTKEPRDSIHGSNSLIMKIFQDVCPQNKCWLIRMLFHDSASKNTHLLQLNSEWKDTKTTVECNVMTRMKHTLQHF